MLIPNWCSPSDVIFNVTWGKTSLGLQIGLSHLTSFGFLKASCPMLLFSTLDNWKFISHAMLCLMADSIHAPIHTSFFGAFCMLIGAYSLRPVAGAVWEQELWVDWDLVHLLSHVSPSPAPCPTQSRNQKNEYRKKGENINYLNESLTSPLHLCADCNPIISGSSAPSIVPEWNSSSKTTYTI